MPFKSIRTRLIVSICVLTLLCVLAMQVVNIGLLQNAFSSLVPSAMETSLQMAHMQIHAKLEANFAALEAIANMPFIRNTELSLQERAESLSGFIAEGEAGGYRVSAITDTTGRAVLSSGYEIDVSSDAYFTEAVTGKRVVSDPFHSVATGELIIVYAVPYYNNDGRVAGVITLDVDALHLSRGFEVLGLGESGVAFAIAQDGTTVVSTDLDTVTDQLNDFDELKTDPSLEGLVASERKMVQGEAGNSEHDYMGVRELIYYMPIADTTWAVAVTEARSEAYGVVNAITYTGVVVLVVVVLLSVVAGTLLARSIARPIVRLADAANGLARGDIDVSVGVDTRDETGVLAAAFRGMTENIRQQADVINSIAKGDYTVSIPVRSEADVMNKAINHMVDSNNDLMGEIRGAAEQVATGASQIADGSQTLATGSTEQAATMQQFSASISEVRVQAETNTELARATVEEVGEAGRMMEESIASMQEMTAAMNLIEQNSHEMAKVIKAIEDIAFQTNILALNAAVEAARAGQHGKGFAVVADEVRNLAGKSAEATKETTALIGTSVQNIARGVAIAGRTREGLVQVGIIAGNNATAMGRVSEASEQQGAAIREINSGIDQISSVVQANSATAEESAALAQELSAQSALLNRVVDRFKLRGEIIRKTVQPQALPDFDMMGLPSGEDKYMF